MAEIRRPAPVVVPLIRDSRRPHMTEPARQAIADTEHSVPSEYGAESIRVLKGSMPCASGRACISATRRRLRPASHGLRGVDTRSRGTLPVTPHCRGDPNATIVTCHEGRGFRRHSQGEGISAEVIMTQLPRWKIRPELLQRCQAACMASASLWSTAVETNCNWRVWADGRSIHQFAIDRGR